MKPALVILRRELGSYFATPIAYVFIFIFLFLSSILTLSDRLGGFFPRGQADLQPFFGWLPIVYLFLIPAISMRLWAEERKSGTIELLLTLPVTMVQAMVGKFLAAWLFTGIALLCTFPLWLTVNYLGTPDNGVIVASYLGAFLMAGSYLAIGACISALTKNQVIAFVVSVVVCFVFVVFGWPLVTGFLGAFLPASAVTTLSSISFVTHFEPLSRGVVDARDVIFFLSMMAFWLLAGAVALDARKAS